MKGVPLASHHRSIGRRLGTLAVALPLAFAASVVGRTPPPVNADGATINVTTTADVIANDGECSLREAVIAANTNAAVGGCEAGAPAGPAGDNDVISLGLSPATYELAIAGAGEDHAATGDLDIREGVSICCWPTIDANGLDRVIDVHPNVRGAALSTVSLTGGSAVGGDGGAIRVLGGCDSVNTTSTFFGVGPLVRGNTAANGGAIYAGPCTHFFTQASSIVENTASGQGGGIYAAPNAAIEVWRSTLARNTAMEGGAISAGPGGAHSVVVIASTITENSAQTIGGIRIAGDPSSLTTVTTNIIAGNTGGDCAIAGTVHGSHNLVGDATCPDLGEGSMHGTDPLLGEMTAESTTALVYRPLPGSPAIDTGREMVFEGGSTHDQVGTVRPLDGDGDGFAGYDIGSIEAYAYPFTDVAGSPFRVEIRWLWEEEITLGCGGTRFCPTAPVTREQMASFLVRALDLPATANDYFVDDEASGHEADINALRAAGITNGCGSDPVVGSPTFGSPIYCPTAAVTRAEMASFLTRAFALPAAAVDYFDDDDGNVFHENDINAIAQAEITLGCGARNYCPGNPVLREQMAAFLYRGLND